MGKLNLTVDNTPVDDLQERMIINKLEGNNPQGDLFAQKVAEDIAQEGTAAPVSNVATEGTLRQAIENFTPEQAADAIGQPVETNALDPRFVVPSYEQRLEDNTLAEKRALYDRLETQRNPDGTLIKIPSVKIFKNTPNNSGVTVDGNMATRSQKLVNAVDQGLLGLGLSGLGTSAYTAVKSGETGPKLADNIAQYSKGNILAAISRSDAVITKEDGFKAPNRLFTQVGSLVTENMLMNVLANQTQQQKDALQETMGQESLLEKGEAINKTLPKITQTTANTAIGQEIHLEYVRMRNAVMEQQGGPKEGESYLEARRIDNQEAATLGAAFKHLWAESNPELVKRVKGEDNQMAYVLSPEGEAVLRIGESERQKYFPRQLVRPLKVKGQIDNTDVGLNVARYISGGKKGQDMGVMLKEAIKNLSSIAHVVDKQRLSILFATSLNVLAQDDVQSWEAEINGVGETALDKFNASKTMQDTRFEKDSSLKDKEAVYDVEQNMTMKRNKLANEIRSMTQNHESANYLSWNIQGYQGRLTPQQSYFNPTTSKQVRFVTRGANPAIIKIGSQQERNVRQMFAMLLVPKTYAAGTTQAQIDNKTAEVLNQAGDTYLPEQRDFLLTQQTNVLYEYGARLTELMAITDTDYNNIIEAINAGVSLNNPSFPKVNNFNLDPEKDARLIGLIKKNGDDAGAYMDALIEFKKYIDFKNGVTDSFSTYLNAYIDGKTNGPASNAMMLGKADTSFLTGVLRKNRTSLLDTGDMRDQLMDLASESIQTGWKVPDEAIPSMNNIAMEVFANRDLAKYTIMTFGYGKEIESFGKYIEEVITLLGEKYKRLGETKFADDLKILEEVYKNSDGLTGIARDLNNRYAGSIVEVLGKEPIEARSIMRAIAAEHAMMNEPFIIYGPSGMQIHIGGESSTGYDNADMSTYRLSPMSLPQDQFETSNIATYNKEATAAASRTREGQSMPGELAYGGSAVAPIQAVDAAVVMMTASGESFRKLSAASGGNPYMHTIYDAFKMDANGYHVMLQEVNKNWEKATMNWSYLEQAKKSLEAARERYRLKMLRDDNRLTVNESIYMEHLLKVSLNPTTGKRQLANLRMNNFKGVKKTDLDLSAISNDIRLKMKEVGYDIINPPDVPTIAHIKKFRQLMVKYFDTDRRLNAMIKETNKNKIELAKDIKKFGYKYPNGEMGVLQYFAH